MKKKTLCLFRTFHMLEVKGNTSILKVRLVMYFQQQENTLIHVKGYFLIYAHKEYD